MTDLTMLIRINRDLWGKVKDFATVKNLTLYSAVELLLRQALVANGYHAITAWEERKQSE